jgi:hypothetical protein
MDARGYKKEQIEHIIRFSSERYFDTETRRFVIVGKHGAKEVIIPYDIEEKTIIPVTIHAISRQQIRFRKLSGRFEDAK